MGIEAESVLLPTAISIKVYLKNKHAASSLVFEVSVTNFCSLQLQDDQVGLATIYWCAKRFG